MVTRLRDGLSFREILSYHIQSIIVPNRVTMFPALTCPLPLVARLGRGGNRTFYGFVISQRICRLDS